MRATINIFDNLITFLLAHKIAGRIRYFKILYTAHNYFEQLVIGDVINNVFIVFTIVFIEWKNFVLGCFLLRCELTSIWYFVRPSVCQKTNPSDTAVRVAERQSILRILDSYHRVFIKYCFFFKNFKIYSGLWPLSDFRQVCTQDFILEPLNGG